MTKADIVASVGRARYDAASRILKKLIAGPDPDLPHDVSPAVWDLPLPQVDRIYLFFELYDDLPSYGMLMYATHEYPDFDERAREVWWSQCLKRIGSGQDVVSESILYALWCDYFEDPKGVEEVWGRLSADNDPRTIEAILKMSGPVPWSLKEPLHDAAVKDASWHMTLPQAPVGSAFDSFGKIELEPARRLLARLQVPPEAQGYAELQERLGK